MPIKYEDANMLRYFHEEKGDVTRYIGYEKLKKRLDDEYGLHHYLITIELAERNFKIGDVWKPNCIMSFTEVKHVYDIKSNPLGSAVTNTKYEVLHNYVLNEHVKAVEVSWLNGFRTELYKFHEKTSFAEILAK